MPYDEYYYYDDYYYFDDYYYYEDYGFFDGFLDFLFDPVQVAFTVANALMTTDLLFVGLDYEGLLDWAPAELHMITQPQIKGI